MEWRCFISRGNHPLLFVDQVFISLRDLFGRYFVLPEITTVARHSGSVFYDAEELEIINKKIKLKLFTNWPKFVISKQLRDITKFVAYSKKMSLFQKINKKQLQKFFSLGKRALVGINLPIHVQEVLERELQGEVLSLDKESAEAVMEQTKIFYKQTIQQKYFDSVKKLSYTKILKKYPWIKSYFMEIRPLTHDQYLSDKKIINTSKRHDLFKKVKVSEKTKRLVFLIRFFNWFREERLFRLNSAFYFAKPALVKYGEKFGLNYDDIKQLYIEEFLSGSFSRADIEQRKKEFGILLNKDKILVFTGGELQNFKKKFKLKEEHLGIIKGQIASRGLVSGIVFVANPYTFNQIKDGVILVAPETTPESSSFIRRVKAIVTDEGGITCHAAIISRELGIPCIIGTKIATKVLKNGDEVEVDANQGVVNVIKPK